MIKSHTSLRSIKDFWKFKVYTQMWILGLTVTPKFTGLDHQLQTLIKKNFHHL